jgi:hypothetical protein
MKITLAAHLAVVLASAFPSAAPYAQPPAYTVMGRGTKDPRHREMLPC